MKSIHCWPHEVHNTKCLQSYQFWTLHFVSDYKSPRISKTFLQVTLNNITQKWCPAARQGPIYKPTRSKLKPKCSYYSTSALMLSLPSNATFSGFPKNKQAWKPHHKLLTVIVGWVYPTDDVRAEQPWHRGLRRVPLCLPRVWCVPLNCHWKGREGAWPRSSPDHSEPIEAFHCAFHDFRGLLLTGKKWILIYLIT